jgi:hypothetical protein
MSQPFASELSEFPKLPAFTGTGSKDFPLLSSLHASMIKPVPPNGWEPTIQWDECRLPFPKSSIDVASVQCHITWQLDSLSELPNPSELDQILYRLYIRLELAMFHLILINPCLDPSAKNCGSTQPTPGKHYAQRDSALHISTS